MWWRVSDDRFVLPMAPLPPRGARQLSPSWGRGAQVWLSAAALPPHLPSPVQGERKFAKRAGQGVASRFLGFVTVFTNPLWRAGRLATPVASGGGAGGPGARAAGHA
jgi:hypothetical protein